MDAKNLTFYVSLFLMVALSIEKRVIPKKLQQAMARVDSVESFLREVKFNSRRVELTALIARSGHVNELDVPLLRLENEKCVPRPVVLAVPQPNHKGFYFPFYVKLHRCSGACNAKPLITQCVANKIQPLNVRVYTISWTSSRQRIEDMEKGALSVGMLNHTSCKCQCVAKPTDCDDETQEFDEEKCRCVCKNRPERCPPYFSWDHSRCQCRCNTWEVVCPTRHQLDEDTCSCVCSTKNCRWGKVRNPKNCRCYCSRSLSSCPGGTERDPRDCRCKFGSFRLKSGQFRGNE